MTTTTSRAGSRLPSLTGLRWFAAFLVFGFHIGATPQAEQVGGVFTHLFASGASGVTFFFILSGFVLTWSVSQNDSPVRFWRRRAARVLPNHVAAWLGVLLLLAVTHRAVGAGPAALGLVLGQAWVPDEDWYFAGNTPAWSLSCELAFYAAFPLLIALVRRIPSRMASALLVGLVAAVWLVPTLSLALDGSIAYWLVWIFPLSRMLDFAVGITLARLVLAKQWRGPGIGPACALVALALAVQPRVPQAWGYVAWLEVPFALLIAAAARADAEGLRSPFRTRPVEVLGEISFAFYLVHQPVIRAVLPIVGGHGALALTAGVVAALGAATAVAWVLHARWERPMERLLAGRRRVLAATAPSAAPVSGVL